jgi:hypothetical protein
MTSLSLSLSLLLSSDESESELESELDDSIFLLISSSLDDFDEGDDI